MQKNTSHQRTGLSLRANFSWSFIGNTINAFSWFVMTIILAKLGSPEHVGQFAIGLAIAAPVYMFATLRLRDVQATDAKGDFLFGDYFAMRLTTTVVAFFVVAGIAFLSGLKTETALVVMATALSKSVEAVSDALYGLFMQHERLDLNAKSLMLKGPLSLVGLAIGFYFTGSVFWSVIGMAIGRFIILATYDIHNAAMFLYPGYKRHKFLPDKLPQPRWDFPTLKRLFWITLPLGFVTMLISFNSNIPRYFIEGHLGSYQLGIFAAVASFQKVSPMIVQALGRSASPRLAKYFGSGNAVGFRKLSIKLIGVGLVMAAAGVAVALLLGRQILTIFFGPEYVMPRLFSLVMLASGIDFIATMLLFVITSARLFRIQLPLHIATTAVIAVLAYFLVPSLGLEGGAIALVCGDLVRAGSNLAAAWHAQRTLARQVKMTGEAPIGTAADAI